MAVYVDDARNAYRGMIMCHMWADNLGELHAMAALIGIRRIWFQTSPHASWDHYDICLKMKRLAIIRGAIQSTRLAALRHRAVQRGDHGLVAKLDRKVIS